MSFWKKVAHIFVTVMSVLENWFEPLERALFTNAFALKTLVMMQLKDKLNFSFKADKKGALTKLILFIILFIVVTAFIAVLFFLMNFLAVFGSSAVVPISIFNLFFISMLILSTISCITQLTNSLFFSKDNLVLLSYPV